VVHPLYETLAKVSPNLGAKCLTLIDANCAMWRDIIAHGEASSGSGHRWASLDRAHCAAANKRPTKYAKAIGEV
jgi:hypothetical protein